MLISNKSNKIKIYKINNLLIDIINFNKNVVKVIFYKRQPYFKNCVVCHNSLPRSKYT